MGGIVLIARKALPAGLLALLLAAPCAAGELHTVQSAISGDTIILEDGNAVQYIGIYLPDSKNLSTRMPIGYEAWEANRRLVEGKKVRLEFDTLKRDRHGRLLAYVYLPDGTFVNVELVRQGYAFAARLPPNLRHEDEFFEGQREARLAERGVWGK